MAQKHWQKKFGQAGDTLENEGIAMIEIAQIALAIYGILLIVGGTIGKMKSGSSASLFAGAICGIAALIWILAKSERSRRWVFDRRIGQLIAHGHFYEPICPHAKIYARRIGAAAQSFGGYFDNDGETGIPVKS